MKTIDDEIKNNTIQKVYLLYGEENYLKRQYKQKLKNAIISPDDTMNFMHMEGKEVNTKAVIDLAETLPFFAERRMILLENTGMFKTSADDMAEYMAQILESCCIVFVENEVDKRSKLFKAVQKNGSAVEFIRQTQEILMRWVLGRLKKEGKNIKGSAMTLFFEKSGDDMENIDSELEKLICYVGEKENIECSDVEAVCIGQITNQIFDMVNAIAEQNQTKALQLYFDLISLKEPPMRILFLIIRQFQILYQIKDLKRLGYDQKTITSKLKMPEFVIRKNLVQVRDFSLEMLEKAIEDGIEAETNIKTGMMTDQLATELFLIRYSQKQTLN